MINIPVPQTTANRTMPDLPFPYVVLASPPPIRAPGYYWVTRAGQAAPPQPGQWMDGLYWLLNGQAVRDDEVTVHGDRLDSPQANPTLRADPEWIREPVAAALAALNAAMTEAQDAVRLHIATGDLGNTALSDLVARRDLAARAVEALSGILATQ